MTSQQIIAALNELLDQAAQCYDGPRHHPNKVCPRKKLEVLRHILKQILEGE